MPCSDHAVLLKATAWSEHGMASVNQTQRHCVNQIGKTHSKPLAARHGRGTTWARHAMCESALIGSEVMTFPVTIFTSLFEYLYATREYEKIATFICIHYRPVRLIATWDVWLFSWCFEKRYLRYFADVYILLNKPLVALIRICLVVGLLARSESEL